MAPAFGGWAMLSQAETVEALGRAGFDFVGLDLQHGAIDVRDAQRALGLLDALGTPSFVRLAYGDRSMIPRVLDFGADGVIVAMIDDAEQAADCVGLSRYQPDGTRSYGGQRHGLAREPQDLGAVRPEVHAMIETRRALDAVEQIAAVPDLKGLAVGPVDLGLALRPAERPHSHEQLRSREWEQALDRILEAARGAGLTTTTFAVDGDDARWWSERGFDRIVIASDVALMRRAFAEQLRIAAGS